MNYLLQPKKYQSLMADEGSKAIMNKTIAFFEKMAQRRNEAASIIEEKLQKL